MANDFFLKKHLHPSKQTMLCYPQKVLKSVNTDHSRMHIKTRSQIYILCSDQT